MTKQELLAAPVGAEIDRAGGNEEGYKLWRTEQGFALQSWTTWSGRVTGRRILYDPDTVVLALEHLPADSSLGEYLEQAYQPQRVLLRGYRVL
jgi:hypothetical protein